jgi:hypothetical protein
MRLSHVLAAAVSPVLFLVASASGQAGVPVDADRITIHSDLADGIRTNLEGLRSFRDGDVTTRLVTVGDTFNAALLGQSASFAGFVTNSAGRVTTFTWDLLGTAHGTLVGTNATVNEVESQTPTGVNTFRVRVGLLTGDSSSLWINGLTFNGEPMTQGRVDVGAAAFTNGLLWDNLPGPVQSITVTNALFADGVLQATSSSLGNLQTLPVMGSAVIWNGVVGSPIDETQMVFDITVPEPASLGLLGLAGLMLGRRRR